MFLTDIIFLRQSKSDPPNTFLTNVFCLIPEFPPLIRPILNYNLQVFYIKHFFFQDIISKKQYLFIFYTIILYPNPNEIFPRQNPLLIWLRLVTYEFIIDSHTILISNN